MEISADADRRNKLFGITIEKGFEDSISEYHRRLDKRDAALRLNLPLSQHGASRSDLSQIANGDISLFTFDDAPTGLVKTPEGSRVYYMAGHDQGRHPLFWPTSAAAVNDRRAMNVLKRFADSPQFALIVKGRPETKLTSLNAVNGFYEYVHEAVDLERLTMDHLDARVRSMFPGHRDLHDLLRAMNNWNGTRRKNALIMLDNDLQLSINHPRFKGYFLDLVDPNFEPYNSGELVSAFAFDGSADKLRQGPQRVYETMLGGEMLGFLKPGFNYKDLSAVRTEYAQREADYRLGLTKSSPHYGRILFTYDRRGRPIRVTNDEIGRFAFDR